MNVYNVKKQIVIEFENGRDNAVSMSAREAVVLAYQLLTEADEIREQE